MGAPKKFIECVRRDTHPSVIPATHIRVGTVIQFESPLYPIQLLRLCWQRPLRRKVYKKRLLQSSSMISSSGSSQL